jgi:hypothetical protein
VRLLMGRNKGQTRLTPGEYVPLVVRVLGNRHAEDIMARAEDVFGKGKAARLGPVDMSRNMLLSWCYRYCRTYDRPPLVTGLSEELATVCGDRSASTTVARYQTASGRPMPTTMVQASAEAQRYEQCAGYAGVRLGYSQRSGRLLFEVVTPDDLELEYSGDDPTEPTVVRHRGSRTLDGHVVEVVEVYDLTDLENPRYTVHEWDRDGGMFGEGAVGENITARVHGAPDGVEDGSYSIEGDDYRAWWSYPDGTPYHPIVVRGHPRNIYQRLQQVEASLVVPARWTNWASGTDLSSHPRTHVRGLAYVGLASDTSSDAGGADGPEVIHRWENTSPDVPGDHWQDQPAFDPEVIGRAIAAYEAGVLSALDHHVEMSGTGGEPTAREAEAQELAIEATFAESRRFDGELLRRAAAMAMRHAEVEGTDFSMGPYGLLYRGEIAEALEAAETQAAAEREAAAAEREAAATAGQSSAADQSSPTDPSNEGEEQ